MKNFLKHSELMKAACLLPQVEGCIVLQQSPRKVGIFEALNAQSKPLQLISLHVRLAEPGTLPDGRTMLPFEFLLRPATPKLHLYETYHGVCMHRHRLFVFCEPRPAAKQEGV